MAESQISCKYWRFGFCSRGDKCKYLHDPAEFGIDRDPNLPEDPTMSEQWSGHRSGPSKKRALSTDGYSLTVFGLPWDTYMREATQVFRQYEGFTGCQMRADYEGRGKVAYVQFEQKDQAEYVMEHLKGYVFDEQNPRVSLRIIWSKKADNIEAAEAIFAQEEQEAYYEEVPAPTPIKTQFTKTATMKGGKGKGKGKGKAPY